MRTAGSACRTQSASPSCVFSSKGVVVLQRAFSALIRALASGLNNGSEASTSTGGRAGTFADCVLLGVQPNVTGPDQTRHSRYVQIRHSLVEQRLIPSGSAKSGVSHVHARKTATVRSLPLALDLLNLGDMLAFRMSLTQRVGSAPSDDLRLFSGRHGTPPSGDRAYAHQIRHSRSSVRATTRHAPAGPHPVRPSSSGQAQSVGRRVVPPTFPLWLNPLSPQLPLGRFLWLHGFGPSMWPTRVGAGQMQARIGRSSTRFPGLRMRVLLSGRRATSGRSTVNGQPSGNPWACCVSQPPYANPCRTPKLKSGTPRAALGMAHTPTQAGRPALDVLGIGEEAVSAHEGLRAASIVRQLYPECVIVAGGTYFSNAIGTTLDSGLVDVVVRGEGEQTFVELLGHMRDRASWHQIAGLAFVEGDRHVVTPARKLISDLDTLPWPAYDLVDMTRYGRGSRNHPALVSLEHSRGCIDTCGFCVLWSHMGEHPNGNGQVRPCYRTKSDARSFDEVVWLYRRFGRHTFAWVDPTFNASPTWSDAWAERMLKSDLVSPRGQPRTLHTAWLARLHRAGRTAWDLGQACEGRPAPGRHWARARRSRQPRNAEQASQCPRAVRRGAGDPAREIPRGVHHRQHHLRFARRHGGRPARIIAWHHATNTDFCFLIPLTPCPGTPLAAQLERGGYIDDTDLRHYNFHTPVCRTDTLDLRDLENASGATLGLGPKRLLRIARDFLLQPDSRKRRVNSASTCTPRRWR